MKQISQYSNPSIAFPDLSYDLLIFNTNTPFEGGPQPGDAVLKNSVFGQTLNI